MISEEQFLTIVDATPMVSIDLIIENQNDDVLLGKRLNRPAMGYWFVPGGRIRKNERLSDAMARISSTELGTEISLHDTRLLGAYEHIYDDNYSGKKGINTHYVVLAYKIPVQNDFIFAPDNQHSEIKWWPKVELLASEDVHENTKAYFINT